MQCDRARELIGPHLDGELSGSERQDLADHLQTCTECSTLAQDIGRIGRQIAAAGRETAPKALAVRIRAALAEEAATVTLTQTAFKPEAAPVVVTANARPDRSRWTGDPMRRAAALAACAVLSSALTWGALTWAGAGSRLEAEIVSAHIRSLLQDSQIQIASSDAHTVKPWFMGRIDFAPDVKDLTAEGFPLTGGRLDYIGDRRVGAIVYRRRQHVVNVFMWPAAGAETQPPRLEKVKGYHLMSWSRGGVDYRAISDLNVGELQQLQSLL